MMIVEKLLAPLRRGEQLFWNLIDILQQISYNKVKKTKKIKR
jgi:hypothetical protein